jgi:superfamily II DNA or RNA helicase
VDVRHEPYEYQKRAIEDARQAYRAGARKILIVCPTGGGKTLIGCTIGEGAIAKGGSLLWLAHRDELISQARERLYAQGIERVGVIQSGEPLTNARVQVASIQTIRARAARGLPPCDVVVWDECHNILAETYQEIAAALPCKLMVGLTATPERGDGKGLGDMFDVLIQACTVRELQGRGVLVPCVTHGPASKVKALSMDPVAAYLSRTPGERAFAFCKGVLQAEKLVHSFAAQGVPACTIHGDTPWLLRRARLEAFRTQDNAALLAAGVVEKAPLVICNVYTMTEGVDVREAAHCILARGCGHPGMLLQMVGRVLRAAPGKTRAVLSDLTGVVHKLGLPEADRVWSLHGRAATLTAGDREVAEHLKACPACGALVGAWSTDRMGWRICPECRVRVAPPDVVEVKPREQIVMGAGAPPEERATVLRMLAATAARKGYKAGWASVRYKERFASWPNRGEAASAYARAVEDVGAVAVEAARAALAERRAARALTQEQAREVDEEPVPEDYADSDVPAAPDDYADWADDLASCG